MTSQPLKWHGGKHYLAKRIIGLMPPHLHFVEPYFGGGAVLFAKPCEGVSEVVNDIDGELMNFWECLRNVTAFKVMVRELGALPFSRGVFEWSKNKGLTPVDRALHFFCRYRQSRQGLGKDFATLSRNRTRRGMNEQVSSWLSAIEGLPEAHERLKRVVILFGDALDVIRQQDGPKTHFYCDPPYLHETRTAKDCYEHEMTVEDHEHLLDTLGTSDGTFQLSGYHSKLYDMVAKHYDWRCVEIDLPNNASSAKVKERKVECVWMNY